LFILGFALLGLVTFVVAMTRAEWLPDRKFAEQDERAKRASRPLRFPWEAFGRTREQDIQREHTRALDENTRAMREHIAELQRQGSADETDEPEADD
jgi:hypothetical protein